MKKKGKIKTIVDAFTTDSDLDIDILEFRRAECAACPYNSDNADNANLNIAEKLRKKLNSESFCTACGCQILEKTSQDTEECGAGKINEPLRWNRVKLETEGTTDLNIINKSEDKVNLDLNKDGTEFVVDYGDITREENTDVLLDIDNTSNDVIILNVKAGCGCTSTNEEKLGSYYRLSLGIDLDRVSIGKFGKRVRIKYTQGDEVNREAKIVLTGNLKEKK